MNPLAKNEQAKVTAIMDAHANFSASRIRAYDRLFGTHASGYADPHATDTSLPRIDVMQYPPGPGGRPFYTLVTNGMSDSRMHCATVKGACNIRAEIVLYAPRPNDNYILWLRWIAKFPFAERTVLGHGHTIPWHEPLFAGSKLTCVLLIDSVVRGDRQLESDLFIEGDPVKLLWFVPITETERTFVKMNGVDSLLTLFEQRHHPVAIREDRDSYV